MNERIPREPESPPAGWDPAADRDPRWQGMLALLREADQCRLPTPAEYDAIREAIRRETASARPSNPGAGREDSFLGWLRHVLAGGGAGAHALRYGLVGAVALWIGASLVPGGKAARSSSDPTLGDDPPGIASVQPDEGAVGIIERSAVETTPAWLGEDDVHSWEQSLPSGSNWEYPGRIQTVSTAPSAGPTFGRGGARSQRVGDLLQQLRLHSLMNRDEEALTQIRSIESVLEPLMTAGGTSNWEAQAFESFRRGEDLAGRRRYADALLAFSDARSQAPRSLLALMAQLQIAHIEYERLGDYESALEAYRVALDGYPAHLLDDAQRAQVVDRIDLLTRNSAAGWEAVRLWQQATNTEGPERAKALVELVSAVPQAPLAASAAVELARLASEEGMARRDAEELAQLLDQAVEDAGDAPHAAALQFTKAEVVRHHLLDPDRAREEYLRVLTLPSNDEIARLANDRVQKLCLLR